MDKRIPLLILVTLAAIFFYGRIDYASSPFVDMDLKYYRLIADASPSVDMEVPRPFSYRLLGPYLSGLAGDGRIAGFQLLTIFSSLAMVICLYFLFISMGISRSSAFLALVMLVLNKHLFGSGNWNIFQVKDTLSMALVAVMFLALRNDRRIVFSVALAVGAASGELALLMIPVLFLYDFIKGRLPGNWKNPILVVLPALIVFVVIRLVIPPVGGMSLFEAAVHYGGKLKYPMTWFGLLLNPFIPLTFLPLIFFRETGRFVRENTDISLFFILVLVSAFFGSNNERLMAPAAISFFALIAGILDRPDMGGKMIRGLILAAGLFSSLHHSMARFPLPERKFTIILSAGSLLFVSIILAIRAIHFRRRAV
ncbi:MAG: hypothetical protein KOO63_05985 [Bacteroidales bacterium]|nr:hypothetical protein [Candidatus Latescibacterota bacterium]